MMKTSTNEIIYIKENKIMKNTIVINLFGGPGCGKSTGAAYIFSQLKLKGINCEYVSEFAKDKVWEKNETVFDNQLYISAKQSYRLSRVNGKVDVVITDAPILIGATHTKCKEYIDVMLYEHKKYNNMNFLLIRKKEFEQNGRNENLSESVILDSITKQILDNNSIEYIITEGNVYGYEFIIEKILHIINYESNE